MKLNSKRSRKQANFCENVKPGAKTNTAARPRLSPRNSNGSQPKPHINVPSKFGLGNFVPPCCCHPQPGDLIEIDRKLYSHWALYIGEDQVVHVSGESYDIAYEGVTVRQSSLEEVAGDSLLRINNKDVPAKERGLKALEPRKIIANARRCVGKVVVHNMLSNNAEHFVTLWRYGVGWSDQVIF